MTYHQELQHRLFQQQEEQVHHMEYQQEFQYYEDVAHGRLDRIHLQLLQPKDIGVYNDGEYGMLSKDPLRNLRYHFVVSVAMITRLCVEHGLEQELAYTMSDLYINKMDELQQAEAIISLQNDMLLDFTQKMADLPKRNGYSIHVIKGIEYICRHLHQRLTVAEVSAALSVNRSYFSALFAKETGCSVSQYIRQEKLQAAANMLRFSDYSYADIAEYFGFSSQSHFIQCFQKCYACTPAAFRKRYFQKTFTVPPTPEMPEK